MQVTAQSINEQFASLRATLEASNQSLEESEKKLEEVTARNAVARQQTMASVQSQSVYEPVQQAPVQSVQQPVQQAPVQSVQEPVQQAPVQPVQEPVQQAPVQPVQEPVQQVSVQEPVEVSEEVDYDAQLKDALKDIKGVTLDDLMKGSQGSGLSL